MDTKEIIAKVLQELILPELAVIKHDNAEIKAVLNVTNKRLDDFNNHLIEQSRRIDDTNKRIDDLSTKFDSKLDDLSTKFDSKLDNLSTKFDSKLDDLNNRMNQLYLVIVRRDEHDKLEYRVMALEDKLEKIINKIAV